MDGFASDITVLIAVPLVIELIAATPWFSSMKESARPRNAAIFAAGYVVILILWGRYLSENWREKDLSIASLLTAPTITIVALVLMSWGAHVLRSFTMRRTPSGRCDSNADWYLDIPIADLRLERDATSGPELASASNGNVPPSSDRSEWTSFREAYQGKTFTLERFKRIQEELLTSIYFRDGPEKWGFETLAYPALPSDKATDPTERLKGTRCIGVGLWFIGRRYLPPKIRERPLRVVE